MRLVSKTDLVIYFLKHKTKKNGLKKKIKNPVDILFMSPLEGDEEVKKGKTLKIVTLNKLLIRLPVLLAQLKAGNDSNILKNEIGKILYLLYHHNKIT